jgi:hypothetical protein
MTVKSGEPIHYHEAFPAESFVWQGELSDKTTVYVSPAAQAILKRLHNIAGRVVLPKGDISLPDDSDEDLGVRGRRTPRRISSAKVHGRQV